MWLIDHLVKRTSAATSGAARMKPLVGPTKFAPAKNTRRFDAGQDTLGGFELEVYGIDGSDPYNARSGRYRVR